MGAYGADPEQLKRLAAQLGKGADQMEHLATSLTSTLTTVGWKGGDAEQFRATWKGTSSASVRAAVQAVRQASKDLLKNAQEQEKTSSVDGAGSSGGSGTGGSGPGGSGPGAPGNGTAATRSLEAEVKELKEKYGDDLSGLKKEGKDGWKFIKGVNEFLKDRALDKYLDEGDLDALKRILGKGGLKAFRESIGLTGPLTKDASEAIDKLNKVMDAGPLRRLADASNPLRPFEEGLGTFGKLAGVTGRALGVFGLATDARTLFASDAATGEKIRAGADGLGTLATMAPTVAGWASEGGAALFAEGGALAAVPVAGEVLIAGAAAYEIYEHREAIAHGAVAAWHGAEWLAGKQDEAVNYLAGQASHALGEAGHTLTSAASTTEHALGSAASAVSHLVPHIHNPF